MTRIAIAIGVGIFIACSVYIVGQAQAATRHHHHRHHHHRRHRHHVNPLRVRQMRVRGFNVRVASYRPGTGLHMVVGASRHSVHTVTHWAGAGRRSSRAVAAINGNTWNWSTLAPVGTVRTGGHWISRISNVPAAGFKANGQIVFGARSAKRAGARNIIPGKAYLLRGGRVQRHFPWATGAQIRCNHPNTDGGYGCWRSIVARWRSGRVGLVEISYASMTQAAGVLKHMGVADALAGDSGGSAIMWTRQGHGGCSRMSDGRVFGHCWGALASAGLPYERAIPNATLIVRGR